jgi:hypothetical protein
MERLEGVKEWKEVVEGRREGESDRKKVKEEG